MSGVMSLALPIFGGVGGFMLGGIGGALMGANLGSALVNNFGKKKHSNVRLPSQTGPRLADLRVQFSSYGQVIPQIYGRMRLSGNVIWSTDIKETRHEHSQEFTQISYSYQVTLAIAIAQGKLDEVTRIWADSKALKFSELGIDQGKFNIHLGSEEQLPDDIIARYRSDDFPAYRGLCYVVIEDFPLEQYGNRIPNFSFEVRKNARKEPEIEDKIRDIIMIPGSGEFVYGTSIHEKKQVARMHNGSQSFSRGAVNMHNYLGKANVILALDQLQQTLPNLEWIGLVVTWFATSSIAGDCRIVPKVEFKDANSQVEPRDWLVAGINREAAEEVLRFDPDTPTYGRTPSDHTIIELLQELRRRNLRVMLYPMIFVDEIEPNPKPWRGRIRAGSPEEIDNWFNSDQSYSKFILHYANLTKGLVDSFVIGSEMVGLTSFTDRQGNYPAVNQFVQLAENVKNIVGNNCLVTYAADWSEYHHSEGGWFNLDPLWSCPSIDFIGIDAYFPLTADLSQSQITEDLIRQGWESGEGWDYYCTGDNRERRNFNDATYAWKNLEYWWNNTHTNPDGNRTNWIPRSKPIWFTEFGFPSVDGASNQPNVFYDPRSIESFFPRASKGKIDFQAQREALNATLDYLENRSNRESNLTPRRFVWCWDARPFPYWPDYLQVWQDGVLWETGHWVNGKLGSSSLSAIVEDILQQIGMSPDQYDASRLQEIVDGYIINQHITAREAIEQCNQVTSLI